jgi:predicted transcriptional regulator
MHAPMQAAAGRHMATEGTTSDYRFQGFASPTTTPVPDQLFDELLYHLSATEIVVLLYIIRRTYGFKKHSDNIALSQMVNGITTKDGKVLDRGTGLSKATVARCLNALEEKGVIERTRRRSSDRGDEPTTYTVREYQPLSQSETPRVSVAIQAVSQQRDTQETGLQETEEQERDSSKIRMAQTSSKSLSEQAQVDVLPPTAATDPQRSGLLIPGLSRRGSPVESKAVRQKRYGPERQRMLAFIEDFAREFNDEAPLASSVSRAYNLWQRSGIPIEAFSVFMYEARSLTQEYSASVQKTSQKEASGPWAPTKNKMAYYFAVLEQLVEQRTAPAVPKGATEKERGNGLSQLDQEKVTGMSDGDGEDSEMTLPDPPESPRKRVSRGNGSLGRPDSKTHAVRLFVVNLAKEFGEQLRDKAELDLVGTLYLQSGLSEEGFLQTLSVVRAIAKGAELKGNQLRLPLFFAILRQQLGVPERQGSQEVGLNS